MRSISLITIVLFVIQGCTAQRDLTDKIFEYTYSKEPTVLDNAIHFKSDTTLSIGGGGGQYSYSWFPNYKVLNDSTYYVYHPNPRPAEYPITDTIMIKVQMDDVKNDTIYWKNDKEFIFRKRLFKLFEYKGVPLEDQ
ncbi:hypothetical protein [uncultured Aquimarina sp.]|uniref:hypothetical protein n=1 Tax=uncultured Aquimarina sp. TaxID=575652 RepID=UPI002617FA87|nr:hypothetical protein [uncultured Aquimarina sp.]